MSKKVTFIKGGPYVDVAMAVQRFHEKFGLTAQKAPCLPPQELFDFKLGHLNEELSELTKAYNKRNLPEFADGIVDLVYVALGLAHLCGIPFNACFREVHYANMSKVRAKKASDSKRGSKLDVVKPPGWQPPDIHEVLRKYGADL